MIKERFIDKLAESTSLPRDEVAKTVSIASKPEFGEYTSNIAFIIAKREGKNPAQIAKELAEKINIEGASVEAMGPYINVIVSPSQLFDKRKPTEKKELVILEGPSVNPNKPWHIGHLRNALIGVAVSNILKADGYRVVRLDYINDLGLQVAQSYWYYKNHELDFNKKFDHAIGHQYVEANKAFEASKDVEKEVRAIMKEMEEKRSEDFRSFILAVVKAQRQTAYDYGVFHDYIIFESDLVSLLKEGLEKIASSPYIKKPEEGEMAGCLVADLSSKMKLQQPLRVLVRSDGTPTYLGKDVIFHLWKFGHLKGGLTFSPLEEQPNGKIVKATPGDEVVTFPQPVIITNIIGNEQTLPQEVVKQILSELGFIEEWQYKHIAYGRVKRKEGSFSGRKGTWIGFTADELLSEGMSRVEKGDKKKLALAAIKFAFLKSATRKDIVFDWDKALSFEGDSGVYLLYAYVRAKHILDKAGKDITTPESLKLGEINLEPAERHLMRLVWLFPDFVEEAAKSFEPNVIISYLLDLAEAFNVFYEKHKVIGSDEEEKRLALVSIFADRLKEGLALLGIDVVEEM